MEYLKGAVIAAVGIAALLVLGGVGLLTYGPGSERDAIYRLGMELKDSESAIFRDVVVGEDLVCGYVNSKNSMGGYVGFHRFIIGRYEDGMYASVEKPEMYGLLNGIWETSCVDDQRNYVDQVRRSIVYLRS